MSKLCPICKKENQCAVQLGEDPSTCWCMTLAVPKGLLAQIPEEERGKSCVCKNCVLEYMEKHGDIIE